MGNLLMHASIPITHAFFSGLLCFLFFSLFFFLVLPLLLSVMIIPLSLILLLSTAITLYTVYHDGIYHFYPLISFSSL